MRLMLFIRRGLGMMGGLQIDPPKSALAFDPAESTVLSSMENRMTKTQVSEILATAIAGEVEAYHFYLQVAERAQSPLVRQIFSELAKEELGHRELLENARRNPDLVLNMSAPAADYRVAEATPLPALSIDMTPADAIALAMKKEQLAVELYAALAAQAADPALAEAFMGLSNMEKGHKSRLEDTFVQIGYPEVF